MKNGNDDETKAATDEIPDYQNNVPIEGGMIYGIDAEPTRSLITVSPLVKAVIKWTITLVATGGGALLAWYW